MSTDHSDYNIIRKLLNSLRIKVTHMLVLLWGAHSNTIFFHSARIVHFRLNVFPYMPRLADMVWFLKSVTPLLCVIVCWRQICLERVCNTNHLHHLQTACTVKILLCGFPLTCPSNCEITTAAHALRSSLLLNVDSLFSQVMQNTFWRLRFDSSSSCLKRLPKVFMATLPRDKLTNQSVWGLFNGSVARYQFCVLLQDFVELSWLSKTYVEMEWGPI